MTILIFWPRFPPFEPDRVSGVEVAIWELANELERQRVDYEVMVPGNELDTGTSPVHGINVRRSLVCSRLVSNLPLSVDQEKQLEEYDSILSIQGLGSRPLSENSRLKRRVVRQLHNVLSVTPLSYSRTLKPSLTEYARNFLIKRRQVTHEKRLRGVKTICVSQHLANLMIQNRLEDKSMVYFIPNGVNTETFRPMQQEKLYDLVFVGGFYWVKGLDLLLAALESLHGGGKSLRLGIVGKFTDAQKRYLMNPIPSSLRSYISFLGVLPHDRIPNIVNSSRFVVIPSRYETFGIVALEAIACGVPVIANNVGALCELVDTSVGRLVWPCDSGSLARAIRECSEDTELQRKCITNGQALAQRYMWKTVVESLIGILTTV